MAREARARTPLSLAPARSTSRSSTTSLRRRQAARTSRSARSRRSYADAACASRTTRSHRRRGRSSSTRSTSTSTGCACSHGAPTARASFTASARSTSLYRGFDDGTDARVAAINGELADATIAISHATIDMYRSIGIELVDPHVVYNPCDDAIFNAAGREPFSRDRRTRVIATSWSDNPRKGGPTYAWLEEHLDWDRYEFTFVGNVSAPLRRAQHVPPVASGELAGASSSARRLRHCHRARRVLERARRGAVVRPAGDLSRERRQRRGGEGGGLRLRRPRGDPRAARQTRRRVRGPSGAHLAAVARRGRRRLPRGARARRVRGRACGLGGSSARSRRRSHGGGHRAHGSCLSARGPAG